MWADDRLHVRRDGVWVHLRLIDLLINLLGERLDKGLRLRALSEALLRELRLPKELCELGLGLRLLGVLEAMQERHELVSAQGLDRWDRLRFKSGELWIERRALAFAQLNELEEVLL